MKKTCLKAIICATLFANTTFAHHIQLNQTLPNVSVAKDGEINLQNKTIQYHTWNSASLNGKVRVIFHIAGRSAVKEKNEALVNEIKNAKFDRAKYQTTTIINADDALVGTGLFVKNSAEKGKLDNPHSQIILDQNSAVKKAWQLKEKESFVAVIDKQGKVQFVSEGKLSSTQIKQIINLVEKLIQQ